VTRADPPSTDVLGQRGLPAPTSISEQYDALLESTADAIVATSLDATILRWNGAAERMFGYPAEQALGQRLSLIVPADRAGETVRMLHSVGQGARVDRLETVRTRRDGSRFDAGLTVTPVRESSGRIVGALLVTRELDASRHRAAPARTDRMVLVETQSLLEKAERLGQIGTWIFELGDAPSLFWSKECYRMLGIAEGTPATSDLFLSLVDPDGRDLAKAAMVAGIAEHRSYEIDHRLVRRDGTVRWLHAWAEPEYDERGNPVRLLGLLQDITERHEADDALRASERRFRLLAENARDLIFRLALAPAPHGEYFSPASVAITGYTPEELYANPLLATGLIAPEHVQNMEALLLADALSEPIDVTVRRKDGSIIWVSQQLTFVKDAAGTLIAVEGIVRDITDRKRIEQDLAYAGLHDALTALPNRLLLHDRVDTARDRARAEGRSVIVVALDLDDFTLINDTHGHDTGDAVLIAVAGALSAATRGHATVARTGSDEFVVVGDDITDAGSAFTFVDRLRDALLQPIKYNGAELFVHARLGATVDDVSTSPESLLRNADIALARAKQQRTGRGVEFFNADMRTRTNERFALVNDLHRALERNEFALRYQPIIRLADERVIGAEALIRWVHPERGVMSPAEFVPLAEDTGLIIEIGAWVLEHACRQLRDWTDTDPGLGQLGMAVNVSVKQLRSPSIVRTVTDALSKAGIAPDRLTIEMTESVFVDDLETIRGVLAQLRALGVHIAVDDFGTGYSSLTYLKHLPLDTLKIDQSFVDGLGRDSCDEAIVASALGISRALGLSAVAEGVETPAQLAVLRTLGCEVAQGFYFSKPVTEVEFAGLVTRPIW
jgi:diguanylate cyclase (GGDEF)-like protein/PAS domain S-box-containing protein